MDIFDMKLIKESYLISRETVEKCMDALGDNWFGNDGEDEYNNDDIIEADNALKKEVQAQNEI